MRHFIDAIDLQRGTKVYCSDQKKFGKLIDVKGDFLIVERGIRPKDHYVPLSAVAKAFPDVVYLNVTLKTALKSGWDKEKPVNRNLDDIPEGTSVVGSDGKKVGTVIATDGKYLLVEKGFFFLREYYVPAGAIASFDGLDGEVKLTVTKEEVVRSGWGQQPEDWDEDRS